MEMIFSILWESCGNLEGANLFDAVDKRLRSKINLLFPACGKYIRPLS